MPKASQVLFEEMGLTKWGDVPGDVPKPKSPRVIAKLGDILDRAERERDRMIATNAFTRWADDMPAEDVARWLRHDDGVRLRYRKAKEDYAEAVAARGRYQRWKLENVRRVPKSGDRIPLDDARSEAEWNVDLINDLRPDFATARELIDANAAFMLADHAFNVTEDKFQEADRQRKRDAAFNILRVSPRRKPMELHL